MQNVNLDPKGPAGELPFIKYAAGNGWSVQSARHKGCHHPCLREAITSWNVDMGRDTPANCLCKTIAVDTLPGWEEARAMAAAEKARIDALAREEAHKAHAAGEAHRRKTVGARGLLPLLAMAALVGAFDDEDDELDGPPLAITQPEIADILSEAGLFHRSGSMSGIVAIPRKLGLEFIKRLEDAIRRNDVEAVRLLCAGVKV